MDSIFSTTERIEILKSIIYCRDTVSVTKLARELGLSKGLVSKYLDILARKGVLERTNAGFVVSGSPLVRGIRILLNIRAINTMTFEKFKFIDSAGLYGNCAKGENTDGSDFDIWVRVSGTEQSRLDEMISELKEAGDGVKVLVLTDERIEQIRQQYDHFYTLLTGGSLLLYQRPAGEATLEASRTADEELQRV